MTVVKVSAEPLAGELERQYLPADQLTVIGGLGTQGMPEALPLRKRGSSTVKRNASMRTGNHAPPGTSEPWSSSARDACPPTDKGDDCGQAARPSSDRLAVTRLRVVLAMHRLDARAAAGEQARRDAQVPDQTGPHHAIHRAVPCAFLVSSRHAAG